MFSVAFKAYSLLKLILCERDCILTGVIRIDAVADFEVETSSWGIHVEAIAMPRAVSGYLPNIRRILIIDPEYPAAGMTRRGGRSACRIRVAVKRIRPLGLRSLPYATNSNGYRPLVRILRLRPIGIRKINSEGFSHGWMRRCRCGPGCRR